MSQEFISRLAGEMLDYLSANKYWRAEFLKKKGQLFYWERKQFKDYIEALLVSRGYSKEEAVKVGNRYSDKVYRWLKQQEAIIERDVLLNQLLNNIIADKGIRTRVPRYANPYKITTYSALQTFKTKLGKEFAAEVLGREQKEGDDTEFTKLSSALSGEWHIAHGKGIGFAVSHGQASAAGELLQKSEADLPDPITEQLTNAFEQYSLDVNTKIDLYSTKVVDKNKVYQSFVPILSFQLRGANLRDSQLEKRALGTLRDAVTKIFERGGILTLPSSPSIKDGVEGVLIHTVVDNIKKRKNLKVTVNKDLPRSIKSKTKGTAKKSSKIVGKVGVAKGGLLRDPKTGRFVSKKQVKSRIGLLELINRKLPDTVAKNMLLPRLQYRTGRFAESVKAVDIQKSPKGYPVVGYTYMKTPYQIFEMGLGIPPWATPERDPRKIIDLSIREIAAQLMQGRFYTRRI